MSPLYLACVLCGRKQAEGLLSRAAWGNVELEEGGVARACPECKEKYSDWERRVVASAGGRVGAVYATDGEGDLTGR